MSDRDQTRQVQLALLALGYSLPRWGADGRWGPETAKALASWAHDHGRAGAPEAELVAALLTPPPTTPQEAALQQAREQLAQWVGLSHAERHARACQYAREGSDDPDTTPIWCGHFVAWCYRASLHRELRRHLVPSDYRIGVAGRYATDPGIGWPHTHCGRPGEQPQPIREYHRDHGGERQWRAGRRLIDQVEPGGVALVGAKKWGGHVVLVESVDLEGKGLRTISGNGRGMDGAGRTPVDGVVRNLYLWSSVAWVLRWAPADFDSTLTFA